MTVMNREEGTERKRERTDSKKIMYTPSSTNRKIMRSISIQFNFCGFSGAQFYVMSYMQPRNSFGTSLPLI